MGQPPQSHPSPREAARHGLRLPPGHDSFQARAVLAGTGLDLAALGSTDRTGGTPLVLDLPEGGRAVLFRSGAVVCFAAPPAAVEACLARIAPHVRQPCPPADRETETLDIRVDPTTREVIEGNTLVIADTSPEKLLLVADIVAKSVSLAQHERSIERQFERIEPFATSVDHRGRGGRAARELLQHLGAALLAEHRVVAGARVDDSPELLWDHPELERLWARVRDEFEIRERSEALHAKLALVSRTAGTALDYLQAARSLRLEWAIVGLIVFEIALTLVQWALAGRGQ
ncbi:MAG: RMD1 family protein [Planctomycetaceae bacterium]